MAIKPPMWQSGLIRKRKTMNAETENIIGAIGGTPADGTTGGGEPDYKALYEEMQRKLQSEKVEAGRLKRSEEEKAALRKELEELKKAKRTEEAMNALPDDLKAEVPDDFKRGSAIIAQKAVDTAMAGTEERLARLEQGAEAEKLRLESARKAEFAARINATFPGFAKSIGKGGDKYDAWVKYQRHNLGSIQAALASCDFDTLKYHIEMFHREAGIPVPSGSQDGAAAPDPRSMGGGASTQAAVLQPGKTYTAQEYQRILNDAQARFQRHVIGYKEYVGICGELTKAYKEGRVK